VSFYHRNNRSLLAERGLSTIAKETPKLEGVTITKTQERQIKARQNLETLAQKDAE
jgi:hypothetical protein